MSTNYICPYIKQHNCKRLYNNNADELHKMDTDTIIAQKEYGSRGPPTERKIYNSYYVNKISDHELFNNLNKYIEYISKKLKICFNQNCKNSRCNNIILLYCNKKVGSTSLWSAFNLYLSHKYSLMHCHSEHELESVGIYNITVLQVIEIFKIHQKKVLVIDIYRPIFDLMFSIFFNAINVEFNCSNNEIIQNFSENEIIDRFNYLFIDNYELYNCDYFYEKYNNQLIADNFNFIDKYLYFKDETIQYLKIRQCDTKIWNIIIKKILNENINMIEHNLTDQKKIGNLYKECKKLYTIPKNYYELIKHNKYFLFYYSKIEQEKYLASFKLNEDIFTPFKDNYIKFLRHIQHKNKVYIHTYESMLTNTPLVNNCICNICCIYRQKKLLSINNSQYLSSHNQCYFLIKM